MEFSELVARRRMVRNYDARPVPPDLVDRIIDRARRAPSAGFAQGQCFVVVTAPEARAAIAALADERSHVERGFDPWLSNAPVHVVVCADQRAYEARYSTRDKARTGVDPSSWPVPYALVDAGAALMLLLLAAVDEGLAAGFLGIHRLPGLSRLLAIPEGVEALGVATLGYPAADRRSSSLRAGWKPLDEVVHRDRWRER
ncbi:MAG: nitroreductase family protein [Actinomycetota bacterium]|nr:nitroreductase family protein [Actinomycetota bacterium]